MNTTTQAGAMTPGLIHVTLKRFCAGPEEQRKQLREPWTCDGGIGATNGSILIYLPDTASDRYRPAHTHLANVIGRFDQKYKPGNASIAVADLSIPGDVHCSCCCAFGAVISSPCTECDGQGRFTHGSHQYQCKHCMASGTHRRPAGTLDKKTPGRETCPECKGAGELTQDIPVPVFDGFIRKRYLSMLQDLKDCILFKTADPKHNIYPFRFDGGRGWVMPTTPI